MKVKLDYDIQKNKGSLSIPDEDRDVVSRLYKAFSTPNKAKKFVKGPSKAWIKDDIYFISPIGSFNFGLAELIIRWIRENVTDREVTWEYTDSFKERYSREEGVEFYNRLKLDLRPYQQDCVLKALYYRFGTFVLGTGAGKTLVIASILDHLFHKKKIKRALIVVPDNGLVLQFYNELKDEYGMKQKITLFYDKYNEVSTSDRLIIANRPLFLARWEQYKKFWKESIDCLIIDEAHSLKHANEVSKCIEKIPSKYKLGFTGTLAEEKEDRFRTFGLLGPVRYEKVSKELRDEGFLSNVIIRRLRLVYPYVERLYKYPDEVAYLEECDIRNKFITKLILKLDQNTLLLVNHLNHGFTLEKYFNRYNNGKKKIYFIRGEVETEIREGIKKLMEEEKNIVCIAITKIFSTGINIKNLHNIILCSGGKSSITVVQSIGRGLRLHPEKKELNLFDLIDVGYKYSIRHAEKRKEIYKQEKITVKEYTLEL